MEEQHILINIGRQFASGGKAVAEAVGRILNVPVYDRELIFKAAEKSGLSPELFSVSDEKRRLWGVGSIFGSNRYGSFSSGLNDGELFRIQSETIRDIASNGSAIFVGRASDYVLRDMRCLNVFIHAPLANRIQAVAQKEHISEKTAEALIEKKDTERARFYNFFTFGHWGKARTYDLCVDSTLLGIEGTAQFIVDFGKKAGLI